MSRDSMLNKRVDEVVKKLRDLEAKIRTLYGSIGLEEGEEGTITLSENQVIHTALDLRKFNVVEIIFECEDISIKTKDNEIEIILAGYNLDNVSYFGISEYLRYEYINVDEIAMYFTHLFRYAGIISFLELVEANINAVNIMENKIHLSIKFRVVQ